MLIFYYFATFNASITPKNLRTEKKLAAMIQTFLNHLKETIMLNKFSLFSGSLLSALLLAACQPSAPENTTASATTPSDSQAVAASAETKRVSITAIVEHPALDNVREGVIAQLKAEGFEEGKNLVIDFQSAQGNPATAAQIAKKFAGDKPDATVAIGTPSAQALVSATQDIPVVFAAVTDPIAAKLVTSWDASHTNVTGVSDMLPLAPQIELMKKIVPNLSKVGYVYSPGEVNSTIVLEQLKTDLAKENIELIAAPAQRTTDVLTAARSLGGKVQIIYTSLDNNVVSSFESMYKAANEIKVPLLASDTSSVARGAVAALGVNYHNIGVKTGEVVARILRGEAAGDIPSQRMDKFDLFISNKHAQEQGISLSDALKQEATQVVE